MKTFKEYIKEHPNLRTRIMKKINPMEIMRDKMDDLKKKSKNEEWKKSYSNKLQNEMNELKEK